MAGETDPVLSVVMCVHDGERHLRESIDAILGQTFADFEFVIVDDGSADGTAEILSSCAAGDPRIRVARQAHSGVAGALVVGCALARGDRIARIDADDVAKPQRFARQMAFLDAHPEVGVLGTGVEVINASGRVLRTSSPAPDHALAAWRLLFRPPVGHPTVMLRRALLARVGGYDPAFDRAEDYELWTRLVEVTRFANLPDALVRYRIHDDRVTARAPDAMREATRRVRHRFLARLLGRDASDAERERLDRFERGSRRLSEAERRAAVELWLELYERMLARGYFRREEAAPVRRELARCISAHSRA